MRRELSPTKKRMQAGFAQCRRRTRSGPPRSSIADLATAEGRQQAQPSEMRGMSPESIKSHALEACRQVAALLDRKAPPVEAEGFKRWLLGVSTRVADAAKEGGFLGFGGTRVSEQETAALKEIAAALGVTPGADALAPSGGTRER